MSVECYQHVPSAEVEFPLYPTIWGDINFEEIHHRTRRLAAFTLRKYGISNSEDIDDALQAGYFKLWRRLQKNPDWFAGKPLNYIIRSIYYCSKVQRLSHYRHHRKTVPLPEKQKSEQIQYSQLEQWIDFQSAIVAVAEDVQNSEYALFALYSLITQVTSREVRQNIGCSAKTMTKYRNLVREKLRQELLPEVPKSDEGRSSHIIDVSIAKLLIDHVSF